MSDPKPTPYVSPQEKLNQMMLTPKEAPAAVDFRAELAKEIYVAGLRDTFAKPQNISQDMIKMLAVMSIDAADILIAQLAKGKR